MVDQTESDTGCTDPLQRALLSKSLQETAQVYADRAAEDEPIVQVFKV